MFGLISVKDADALQESSAQSERRFAEDAKSWCVVKVARHRNGAAINIPPDAMEALGLKVGGRADVVVDSVSVSGTIRIAVSPNTKGHYKVGYLNGASGVGRIQFNDPAVTRDFLASRGVFAEIVGGTLRTEPLPSVFARGPEKPKKQAPEKPTPKATPEPFAAIRDALAAVNEARKLVPQDAELFISDTGDVKMRLTI